MNWVLAIAIATALPACSYRVVPGSPSDGNGTGDASGDAAVDAVVIGDASSNWWDAAWTHRRQVTVQNAELSGPVQGFPLLVRLPAGVGPADLRVLATDQRTFLPHEVDFTSAGGSVIWVRTDLPSTGSTVLWVYYGNASGVPDTSSGAAVFGDLFVSVHHLGQLLNDSTGHNHTASAAGNERPAAVAGLVGEARHFDGSNDHLDLPQADETAYDFTMAFSVSAWIRRASFTAPYQAIVTKGDTSWRLHRDNANPFVGFGTTAGANDNLGGTTNIDDANWHHAAIAFGNSRKRIFVDGAQDAMSSVGATIDTNDLAVSFGMNAESTTGGARYWNGDLDEVRISTVARDAAWMFAEHHAATDADFVQVGPDEPYRP
jgi:biopolymer transport protein ExbB